MKAHISAEDLVLLHLLEAAAGPYSLLEFIPKITKNWIIPYHLHPVAQLFARAEYQPVRACVSVPPRHGKTELLLHAIAWWLSRHPEQICTYISYAAEFAQRKSKRAMELARKAKVPLAGDIQRASYWQTGVGTGGMMATGIGGIITGEGSNLMIIDDPTKNREEAESVTIRNKNWDWFTSTAMTRVEPGGSVIVVHTRWHDDDLIGRLAKDRGWEYVNLPAIAQKNDPLGRRPGATLWPSRWPLKELKARRQEVGEYDWASMFQGMPRPKGGRLFKEPQYYNHPNVRQGRALTVCDPAATGKTYADHSAIVTGMCWIDPITNLPWIDVVEVQRLQVEIPILVQKLKETQERWGSPVGIEAVGGFKAVPQMLRRVLPGVRIQDLNATTDKFTRSLPAAAAWNDGRIRLPTKPHHWAQPFLDEVCSFTGVGDAHDDQVDALSHLYQLAAETLPRKGHGVRTSPLPFG